MDYKAISELLKNMSESKLSYLEIESEGVHITMKKEYGTPVAVPRQELVERVYSEVVPMGSVTSETVVSSANVNTFTEKAVEAAVQNPKPAENLYIVKSPIVGTFYSSSNPEAEPFVKVGTTVKKGDCLCIIEAMKLMNEIESEIEGKIAEVYCSNEQLVEYDQPLFAVKIK